MKPLLRRWLPDLYVRKLSDIPLSTLRQRGIKGFILDLDNTLVAWNGYQLSQDTVSWIEQVKSLDFQVYIVSNALPRRVRYFSEKLDVPGIHSARKPRRRGFREALRAMGLERSEVAVVGDQVFTDVWGGKRMGLFTILVIPLNKKEFFWTRLIRKLERWLLKKHWGKE